MGQGEVSRRRANPTYEPWRWGSSPRPTTSPWLLTLATRCVRWPCSGRHRPFLRGLNGRCMYCKYSHPFTWNLEKLGVIPKIRPFLYCIYNYYRIQLLSKLSILKSYQIIHPRKLRCPLKINGWFRCISYWTGPFKKGTFLRFREDHIPFPRISPNLPRPEIEDFQKASLREVIHLGVKCRFFGGIFWKLTPW